MANKISKSMRHSIYKEALIQYRKNVHDTKLSTLKWLKPLGICSALNKAIKHLGLYYTAPSPYGSIEYYPEISRHALNKDKLVDYVYWWSRTNVSVRIRVLKMAIRDTAPDSEVNICDFTHSELDIYGKYCNS